MRVFSKAQVEPWFVPTLHALQLPMHTCRNAAVYLQRSRHPRPATLVNGQWGACPVVQAIKRLQMQKEDTNAAATQTARQFSGESGIKRRRASGELCVVHT